MNFLSALREPFGPSTDILSYKNYDSLSKILFPQKYQSAILLQPTFNILLMFNDRNEITSFWAFVMRCAIFTWSEHHLPGFYRLK